MKISKTEVRALNNFSLLNILIKKESSSKNNHEETNAQFPDADAYHAVASYHGVSLDNRVAEKVVVVVVMKVEQVKDSQQHPSDCHSDLHSDAQDLVLLSREKVMFQVVPSQWEHYFPVFVDMIVSIGQDSHGNHCEED